MPLNDFSFYLDFGATHTKALVQSMSSQKTFSFLEPAPNLDKIENKRSYSPADYSTHAVKIFTSLVKKFGIPKNIAISGQMATYVIVDENSEPITPIISWQDTSSLNVKNYDGIDIYTYAKNIIENREDGFRPGLPSVSLMAYLAEQKYALNQHYFYIPLTNFVLGSIVFLLFLSFISFEVFLVALSTFPIGIVLGTNIVKSFFTKNIDIIRKPFFCHNGQHFIDD
jgi:hypothetical protein